MNKLRDDELFQVPDDNLIYPECRSCLCRMCAFLRSDCKSCYMCAEAPFAFYRCQYFVPFIFLKEPYKEHFREMEKLRGLKKDPFKPFD